MAEPITSTVVPISVATLKVQSIDIFEGLMETATGDKSIYKDAMDKIDLIATDAEFSPSERAKLISDMASGIVGSVTNQAMQVAFQMAKEDRDATYAYPKVAAEVAYLDAQKDMLEEDTLMVEANKEKIATDNLMTQARIRREYGGSLVSWKNVAVIMPTLTMTDEGNKYSEQIAVGAQAYAQYAKSFRDSGVMGVAANNALAPTYSGYVMPSGESASMSAGLLANQTRTQYRTYLAFEDNKVQHAVNASANMVATMYTTDGGSVPTDNALTKWNIGMNSLLSCTPETCTASVSSGNPSDPFSP